MWSCLEGASSRTLLTAFPCFISALLLACGSTSTQSITGPDTDKCAVSLTAPAEPFEAGRASGAIAVDTLPECAWTAVAEAQWITNVSPAQGQGGGQVQFQIGQNASTTTREGTINVNGHRATIRQGAAVCQFGVASSAGPFAATGGSGTIAISAPSNCAWTAVSSDGWIAVSPSAGNGGGTVTVTLGQNSGAERSGTVTVGGFSVTIVQSGVATGPTPTPSCTVSINPTNRTVAATVSTGLSVAVSAMTSCQWTASSNVPWLTITSGATGSGNGSVGFSVAANTGGARTGSLSIADRTFIVNQASGCTYVIAPTSQTFDGDGGMGLPIVVTTAVTCPWTARADVSWLQVTSGTSGSGPGVVAFQVSPYSGGGSSRTGTITIVNQTFTVTQTKK